MADVIETKKITDLTENTEMADTDLFLVGNAGTSTFRKVPFSIIADAVKPSKEGVSVTINETYFNILANAYSLYINNGILFVHICVSAKSAVPSNAVIATLSRNVGATYNAYFSSTGTTVVAQTASNSNEIRTGAVITSGTKFCIDTFFNVLS